MSKNIIAIILSIISSFAYVAPADASGKIVFAEFAGEGYHICTMNSDGTDVKRLTEVPDLYENLRWSPDGMKILYSKWVWGELWVMNADGSSPELLYKPDFWGAASWSPDGKKIAFSTWDGVACGVAIMDLQTREIVSLVEGSMPVWSPDGSAIAYELCPRSSMLYLIDPETGRKWNIDLRREGLNIIHKHLTPIAWSPDGKRIAFLGAKSDKNWWGIYIMNSDGINVIEKYTGDDSNLVAICPTWSPDGKQIMFQTVRGIERMDVDGRSRKLIYEGGMQPDWQRPATIAVEPQKKLTTLWGYVKHHTK